MCFAPAIRGQFKISQNILLFGSLPLFLTLSVFAITLFKGIPKVHPSTKSSIFLVMLANFIAIGVWVGFYFWMNKQIDTDYFVATTLQNYSIVAVCILIFIMFALYTKSWITIFVAFSMYIGPILERVIPSEINKDPLYITVKIIGCVVMGICLGIYFYKKKKKL